MINFQSGKNRKCCNYKGCKQATQWYCLECGEDVRERDELEAWCAASGFNHRYLHWKSVHKTKEERQEEVVEEAKEEVTACAEGNGEKVKESSKTQKRGTTKSGGREVKNLVSYYRTQ